MVCNAGDLGSQNGVYLGSQNGVYLGSQYGVYCWGVRMVCT